MSRFDRRKFLACGMCAPAALFVAGSAAAACVDPDELSDSVLGMRESLEYTDSAADAKQACSGCSYFKAPKPADPCGHCEVMRGTVSSKGHCVSWTKRN